MDWELTYRHPGDASSSSSPDERRSRRGLDSPAISPQLPDGGVPCLLLDPLLVLYYKSYTKPTHSPISQHKPPINLHKYPIKRSSFIFRRALFLLHLLGLLLAIGLF